MLFGFSVLDIALAVMEPSLSARIPKPDERPGCWICSWVFKRDRPKTDHCQKCGRGFCSSEHGTVSDGVAYCLICRELEERSYACGCGWLDSATNDPNVPVTFDKEVNEYHLMRGGELGGSLILRYCPFCGGSSPKSHREALFLHITHEEMLRLQDLTRDLKTVAEVVTAFGPPDEDYPNGHGVTKPGVDGEADKTEYYRSIRYNNLSPTAVVDVVIYPMDRVHFTYYGKPAKEM